MDGARSHRSSLGSLGGLEGPNAAADRPTFDEDATLTRTVDVQPDMHSFLCAYDVTYVARPVALLSAVAAMWIRAGGDARQRDATKKMGRRRQDKRREEA
jgi:hypothetical protein